MSPRIQEIPCAFTHRLKNAVSLTLWSDKQTNRRTNRQTDVMWTFAKPLHWHLERVASASRILQQSAIIPTRVYSRHISIMRLGHQVHDFLQEMRKLNALLTSEVATVEHAQSAYAAIPMFLNISGIDWAGKANPTQISVRKTDCLLYTSPSPRDS